MKVGNAEQVTSGSIAPSGALAAVLEQEPLVALRARRLNRLTNAAAVLILMATCGAVGTLVTEGVRVQTGTDELLASQHANPMPGIPAALAAAVTVRVREACEVGNGLPEVFEGTGAIYKLPNGALELGTVKHVVPWNFNTSDRARKCHFQGLLNLGAKNIQIDIPQGGFKLSYRGSSLPAIAEDQPVFASLPALARGQVAAAVAAGQLLPVQLGDPTFKSVMIVRQAGSAGPMSANDVPEAAQLLLVNYGTHTIDYNTYNGTNACHGNSGGPILGLDENGNVTNRASGVIDTIIVPGDPRCGIEGSIVEFQSN